MFKLIYFPTIIFIALTHAQVKDEKCNQLNKDNPSHVVLFVHPTDCTKFYKCDGMLACEYFIFLLVKKI